MNKITLFFFFIICSFGVSAQQACQPDESLPEDFIGISPLADAEEPCDTIVPVEPAFLETEYETTFTVFIPASFGGFTLDSIVVNPADSNEPGIEGLPAGLTYECYPENCVFPAGLQGCVKVTGAVDAGVTPDVYDLLITAFVSVANGTFQGDVRFPLPDNPDDYTTIEGLLVNATSLPPCPYQIDVKSGTSTQDVFNREVTVAQNQPNPFSGMTDIKVHTAEAGDYQFQVFNAIGELVHDRQLYINGEENIRFDASALSSGMYFYSISNEKGQITRRMVVQ